MARIALIRGGIVANVIESSVAAATGLGFDLAIESAIAGVGDSYDGAAFTRPAQPPTPPPAAPPALPRHITQHAFRARVGDDLVGDMELAAVHNPADSLPVQRAKAKERARQARTFAAKWIDLGDGELVAAFAGQPSDVRTRVFATVLDGERP